MDYHVFILSRIREAYDRGLSTDEAISHGIKSTAGVVTSAAVVMVGGVRGVRDVAARRPQGDGRRPRGRRPDRRDDRPGGAPAGVDEAARRRQLVPAQVARSGCRGSSTRPLLRPRLCPRPSPLRPPHSPIGPRAPASSRRGRGRSSSRHHTSAKGESREHHRPSSPRPTTTLPARIAAAVRTEVGLARLALGAVALHVVDDNFLQPNPGTSAADHLVGGLVPLAAARRRGRRSTRGFAPAPARRSRSSPACSACSSARRPCYYTKEVGPSGDDFTGLLVHPGRPAPARHRRPRRSGRSRKTDDRLWWRYARRLLIAAAVRRRRAVVLVPVALSYVDHARGARVRAGRRSRRPLRGGRVHDQRRPAPQGLVHRVAERRGRDLVPGPGVLAEPRARCSPTTATASCSSTAAARARARATRTCSAGRASGTSTPPSTFLQPQPDVDPERIGGIGLSVGGEMMIEAAAESGAPEGDRVRGRQRPLRP